MTMESRPPWEPQPSNDLTRSLSPSDAEVWGEILLRLSELQKNQTVLALSLIHI